MGKKVGGKYIIQGDTFDYKEYKRSEAGGEYVQGEKRKKGVCEGSASEAVCEQDYEKGKIKGRTIFVRGVCVCIEREKKGEGNE